MRSRDWISDLFFSDLSPTAHVAVSAPRAQSGPRDIYDTEPVVVLPVEDVRRELVAGVHTVGEPLEVDAPLRVERSLLFPDLACETLRDRQSVGAGKRVGGIVGHGGRRIINTKK